MLPLNVKIIFVSFVDKVSLRKEFDLLKEQFEDLKSRKQISPDTLILIRSMIVLFEVLISVFMEKKTRKTSKNSSIPPSQTGKDKTSTQQGSHSKGPQPNDGMFANVKTTVEVKTAEVNFCTHCGEDLKDEPVKGTERRTQIDILFEKKIVHVDAELKTVQPVRVKQKAGFHQALMVPFITGKVFEFLFLIYYWHSLFHSIEYRV